MQNFACDQRQEPVFQKTQELELAGWSSELKNRLNLAQFSSTSATATRRIRKELMNTEQIPLQLDVPPRD